jgi:hypothetical protein
MTLVALVVDVSFFLVVALAAALGLLFLLCLMMLLMLMPLLYLGVVDEKCARGVATD